MSIENTLTELIAALNANTEALKAAGSAAPAPATRAPRGSKAAAAAPAPAAAAPAPTAKENAVTANDLKKFVKDTRTRLSEVSQEAVKLHKEASAKILKSFGLVDFTSIPDDKVAEMLAAFKAVNVEQPQEDSLEDEDDDGL